VSWGWYVFVGATTDCSISENGAEDADSGDDFGGFEEGEAEAKSATAAPPTAAGIAPEGSYVFSLLQGATRSPLKTIPVVQFACMAGP
jgi:hypothetical protein